MRDYYEVLGLGRDASQDDIKKSYRKLAMQHHPDQNKDKPDSEEKFKEINEAYSVLSDDEKRSKYDNYGHAGLNQGFQSHGANVNFNDFFNGFPNMDEIFGFHFGGRQQRNPEGSKVEIRIDIELEDVLTGVEKNITFPRLIYCTDCNGQGGEVSPCKFCKGTGRTRRGFVEVGCMRCAGSRVQVDKKCNSCNGLGTKNEQRTLSIKIPAGVQDNAVLRVHNEGSLNKPGISRGQLFCHIHIRPHVKFQRDNNNLVLTQTINYSQACLGSKMDIETLSKEKIEFSIPSGTQFGQIFRIKHHGLPTLNSSAKGDLYLQIYIEVPKTLTEHQKKLLKDLFP